MPEAPQVADIPAPEDDRVSHEDPIIHEVSHSHTTWERSDKRRVVTIPIIKLQQLVELCTQVLRESRGLKLVDPDLENAAGPSANSVSPTPVVGTGKHVNHGRNLAGK